MESSEGIQIEYIAIFMAVLFPGALVAFNDELVQASQHLTALRVYSAGIWHNAVGRSPERGGLLFSVGRIPCEGHVSVNAARVSVCLCVLLERTVSLPTRFRSVFQCCFCFKCEGRTNNVNDEMKEGSVQKHFHIHFSLVWLPGVIRFHELTLNHNNLDVYMSASCGLTLFLLPLLLFPLYSSGHGAMVLDVPPTSPLFGYLAPGDVIISVDNVPIRNAQEWLKLNTLTYDTQLKNVNISQHTGDLGVLNNRKGYCVPSLVMEASKITELLENQHVCPRELSTFVKISCSDNITLDDGQSETDLSNGRRNIYCLNAKDVVKLDKCGDGWGLATSKGSSCSCSQDEFCLAPVQEPGMVWVEITYSSLSHECLHEENRLPVSNSSDLEETNCGATFIFAGDVISMAHSIHLTSYQPRWGPNIVAYFPNFLERILIWTFHVSLALALLNGLPVSDELLILGIALSQALVLDMCISSVNYP
ncbi:membrane-bound transcription factor site-2 protease-like protein [Trifolium pratense]|uniref:Membrane-bound transcription factor site-2 protease-like protein n=1 Tax=Trifolium pratense TaxID=57577 RepID=A0A2K3PHR8_TRIPR|nr:membrane-bound transcription factor site-2 protease-like protein [Trifolium pratense]